MAPRRDKAKAIRAHRWRNKFAIELTDRRLRALVACTDRAVFSVNTIGRVLRKMLPLSAFYDVGALEFCIGVSGNSDEIKRRLSAHG
jgi:hypothetical protein